MSAKMHLDSQKNPDTEHGPLGYPTLEELLEALDFFTNQRRDAKLAAECRETIMALYPEAEV